MIKVADSHCFTKSETDLVESFNAIIRHYLAIFNRKTKRYSKYPTVLHLAVTMLRFSYIYMTAPATEVLAMIASAYAKYVVLF